MNEYKIFHVTRNLAKHSFELDDAIHGSPLQKENTDWTLQQPDLYLQRLRSERNRLEIALSDLQFVLRAKYQMEFDNKPFNMEAEDVMPTAITNSIIGHFHMLKKSVIGYRKKLLRKSR